MSIDTSTHGSAVPKADGAPTAQRKRQLWDGTAPAEADYGFTEMARVNPSYRWWKPLLTFVLATVIYVLLVGLQAFLTAALTGRQSSDLDRNTPAGAADLLLGVILMLPALWLAARLVERRKLGTITSVAGHMRWKLLFVGLGLAALCIALKQVYAVIEEPTMWEGAVFPGFTFLLVVFLMVPIQGATEEYVYRGFAMQAVGAWTRLPWLALLVQILLFISAHGQYESAGVLSVACTALIAGWLTIRTGGLEVGIAYHAVNNWVSFGSQSAMQTDGTDAGSQLLDAVPDILTQLAFLVAVEVVGRRLGLFTAHSVFRRTPERSREIVAADGSAEAGGAAASAEAAAARLAGTAGRGA